MCDSQLFVIVLLNYLDPKLIVAELDLAYNIY
jgi:hypothetical protein